MEPQIEVTLLVIRVLERLQIPYMVAGSVAISVHGVVRGTHDSDLVAQLKPGDGARIAGELGPDFYFDVEMAEEAIRRRNCASAIYLPKVFKVDLFALGSGAYDREAFARRMQVPFSEDPPASAFLQSPEDCLLSKLKWYRLGGEVSEQQWRDILGILKVQAGSMDAAYLRQWAAHERVLDLLERAEREAEPAAPAASTTRSDG